MRTRALHTKAWFCAKAIALRAICIGCPIAKPSSSDWGFRDRSQFDEKLKALLFAELLLPRYMTLSPRDNLPHGSPRYNGEHNEIGAVTDGALQTAPPASKSNFRKFRRKHDVRQTGRGRTIASGIPTRAGIPSRWMYCPRDNAAADCEAAGRKLDPKINRIARTPRSTTAKRSHSKYTEEGNWLGIPYRIFRVATGCILAHTILYM